MALAWGLLPTYSRLIEKLPAVAVLEEMIDEPGPGQVRLRLPKLERIVEWRQVGSVHNAAKLVCLAPKREGRGEVRRVEARTKESEWIYEVSFWAAGYDLWVSLAESRGHTRALQIADVKPAESVVEIGIGTGKFFRKWVEPNNLKRYVGVERSAAMLSRARRVMRSCGSKAYALCRADARNLPLSSHIFDVAVSCYMLDMLAENDILEALKEFRRVLRPAGRLLLLNMGTQSPFLNRFWMWLHAHAPALVGGCRPVPICKLLSEAGWQVDHREDITQGGFHSVLVLARPKNNPGSLGIVRSM
jgi:ubiquinone/menaquinone biosynthesis C-methylase UbiE